MVSTRIRVHFSFHKWLKPSPHKSRNKVAASEWIYHLAKHTKNPLIVWKNDEQLGPVVTD